MHYIVHVQLEDFYLLGLEYDERYSLNKPIVVKRDKRVIAANVAAELRRVAVGMDVEQARALAPGMELRAWDEAVYREHRERWLDVCAKYTGIVEPDRQDNAFLDLSLHPNPAGIARQMIEELGEATELNVLAGAGPSKWIARLATHSGDDELAVTCPRLFLSTLALEHLTPVDPAHLARLGFLGYRTIGNIADLPLATLKNQFGEDGLLIHMTARGLWRDTVDAQYPPDQMRESLIFDGLVESLEAFTESLKVLAKRLGLRLQDKDLAGTDLVVEVELEEETKTFSRRFSKPMKCPLSMLSALKLLLQNAVDEPFKALRVQLPRLTRTRNGQQDLLGRSEKAKSMDAALYHLRTVFGDQAVQRGQDLPMPRHQRVLREWKDALGWQ